MYGAVRAMQRAWEGQGMNAPVRSIPQPGELLGTVRTLQDAVEVFRLMKERLGLTNDFMDDVGGLAKGHTDKVLGRSETKRIGYDTFALFAELCAVEFRVYVDMDAVKRMEQRWDERAPRWFPEDKRNKRVSKKLVEAAKPYVYRDAGRSGGLKRAASLPAKLRSKIARKGGKSRMKSATKEELSAMARKGWATRRAIAAAQALSAIASQEVPLCCELPAPLEPNAA